MVTQQSYKQIKDQIQPGDIIAFGGNAILSNWVKLTTQSQVTHVAMVLNQANDGDDTGCTCSYVIEAMLSLETVGVAINKLCKRISEYNGDIWWLPLSKEARHSFTANQQRFIDYMQLQQNKPYDLFQLFGATVDCFDRHPWLSRLTYNEEDTRRWFCSELVAKGLQMAGVIEGVNGSEVTPIDICRFTIYQPTYSQIKGESNIITGFNQSIPTHWGQRL
ncbi:hypothetical protein [Alteromonas ponticola]|uniref:Permuted papain-like amidase YaeF/Yiix C92 family enzyme n=1 Tax=Alteromonas ponticola TaxID=2720613 RepID=A0ABX1R0U6_9ALTE|nr:hypothetical protein [Alteromonas ponticola]NMH59348.1 hypothetical protein [Alteromonas ponticola]